MNDWKSQPDPTPLRISLYDLERLVKACGLSKQQFLERLRGLNPELAERIKGTRQWLKIATFGDLRSLRDLLRGLTPDQAKKLHKSKPFDDHEGVFRLFILGSFVYGTSVGRAVLAFFELQKQWPSLVGAMLADWRREIKISSEDGETKKTLTQTQLAKQARLGQNDISRIESGKYKVKGSRTWQSWQAKVQRIVRALKHFESQERQRT